MKSTIYSQNKLLLPVLALAALAPLASAQNITKSNTTGNLSTTGAWVGGVVPGSGNIAVWDNSVTVATQGSALGSNLTWGGIQTTATTAGGGVDLYIGAANDPNTLTLGASGINATGSTVAVYLRAPIALGANQTWYAGTGNFRIGVTGSVSTVTNNGYTLTIGGGSVTLLDDLTGSGGLTNSGSGTVTITGSSSYTGNTTIGTGSTIQIGSGGSTGSISSSSNVTGSGNLYFNRTDLTFANTISCSISIGQYGPGTLTLTGSSTYTGKTSIWGGTLSVSTINSLTTNATLGTVHSATSNLGAPTSGGGIDIGLTTGAGTLIYTGTGETTDRVVNLKGTTGGATIDQSGTGLLKFVSALTASGLGNKTLTLQGSSAGTGEIAAAIVDSTGFTTGVTKAGNGIWTLSGTNTYTGATLISSGTLQIGSGGSTGTLATASTITDNGSLVFNRSNAITQGTDFSGSAIGGTGSLTKSGSGNLTLNAANTYTGNTTISSGILKISAANNLGDATQVTNSISLGAAVLESTANSYDLGVNRAITLTGAGTIQSDAGTLTVSGSVTNGANLLTLQGAGNTILSGVIGSGAGGVTKAGSGTSTLSGNNTYTGNTTVSAGTLQAGIASVANVSGAFGKNSQVQMANTAGATLDLNGFNTQIGSLTGGGTSGGNVTLGAATLTVGGDNIANPAAYNGNISGSGGLTKIGTGAMVLGGSNSYTGNTTVSAGSLQIGNGGSTGSISSSSIVTGSGPLYFNRTDMAFANTITGSISVGQYGPGTLTFSGSSNYTGTTSIWGGGLSVDTINSVTTNATLGTVHSATSNLGAPTSTAGGTIGIGLNTGTGKLIYTGTGETTDRVINLKGTTGGATIDQSGTGLLKFVSALTATGLGNKTLTLQGSTAGKGEIAAAIVDSAGFTTGVTKAGNGTWTLSGTNTYTGATMVTAGTLVVNGTLGGGGVTVQSGATLGGNITAGGTTSIQSGATLSVGNSPGTGSFSTLNLAGTTVMEFNANPSRGSAGIAYDTIGVSSSLTYGGVLKLTFNGTVTNDAVPPFTLFTGVAGGSSFANVYIYAGGTQITSLTNTSGTWTGLADLGYGSGQQRFTFTQSNGDLIVAVPEPTTWALLAFSLTTVIVLRRRRNS